jgi:hypothetical protein
MALPNPLIKEFGPMMVQSYLNGSLYYQMAFSGTSVGVYASGRFASGLTNNFITFNDGWDFLTPGGLRLKKIKRKKRVWKRPRILPYTAYSSTTIRDYGTAMTISNTAYASSTSSTPVENVTHKYTNACLYMPNPYMDLTAHPQAIEVARKRLAEKATEGLGVNLGVVLAEAHKTSDFILDTMDRFGEFAWAVRRGNVRGMREAFSGRGLSGRVPGRKDEDLVDFAKLRKDFGDRWLAYKYGWTPMLMDIDGAIKSFNQLIVSEGLHIEASGKYHSRDEYTEPGSKGKVTYLKRTQCKMDFVVKDVGFLARVNGIGITNPALVVWELVPYSFVVDWFLPIGNYLEALNAFDGLELANGHQITIVKADFFINFNRNTRVGNQRQEWSGVRRREVCVFDRKTIVAPPPPTLSFKSPVNARNFPDRFATAFGLINNAFHQWKR